MNTLKVPARADALDCVMDFLSVRLKEQGWPERQITRVLIAAEEIFVNIAHYAYAPGEGNVEISLRLEEGGAAIIFADSGVAYNPLEREDPDTTLSAQAREAGGLGIYMVKKSMDSVAYEYRDGQNVLTLFKRREQI